MKPQFQSYVLVANAGRILTGMITAETANSITIRQPDESSETILRINIEELRSTGLSFMPEAGEADRRAGDGHSKWGGTHEENGFWSRRSFALFGLITLRWIFFAWDYRHGGA